MKRATQIRSLGDVRTSVSTHARSTPRRKESTYLEVYLLGKEKERLETELGVLTKRQSRIAARVAEIRDVMLRLIARAQEPEPSGHSLPIADASANHAVKGSGSDAQKWRRMPVEY